MVHKSMSRISRTQSLLRVSFVREEKGMAILVAVIGLSVFSLLSLYMVLNATTENKISDNYESEFQATMAAKAGLNHARALLKGIDVGLLLKGPDGANSTDATYLAQAATFGFRNPVSWSLGRTLNIENPTSDLAGIPDDGLMNTGKVGAANGTILIPLIGIAVSSPNPYGTGNITNARYFVKVTDDNDGDNNPFLDSNKIVIIRSMGVAQTFREVAGDSGRRNSVAVVEAKYLRDQTMNMECPVVVEGPSVVPSQPNMFGGNAFRVDGGSGFGIGTVPLAGGSDLNAQLTSSLDRQQSNNITGAGGNPSIGNVTVDADNQKLLDPNYMYKFATTIVPGAADAIYTGNQSWHGGNAPPLGTSQIPRVTVVDGDLDISGDVSGEGLLLVRGKLSGNGRFQFRGLVLVIGTGDMDLGGLNHFGITGGIFICNVTESGGTVTFGTARLSIHGQSDVRADADAVALGVNLISAVEQSWRPVTSTIDP